MSFRRWRTGFTLIELMIIVAVVALLAALALPLYSLYTHAAHAAKIMHHYDQAVRESQQVLINDRNRLWFDRPSKLPQSTAAWIDNLAGGDGLAPGGGPAFVANDTGDPDRGAIGVDFDAAATRIALTRPAYQGVAAARALVTVDGVIFTTP